MADQLKPDEDELYKPGGYAIALRIAQLVDQHLRELARSADGWSALYQDPRDNRLWELTYPQSEMHGGGSPRLAVVSPWDAAVRYPDRTA
jgi:hypothetical protein